MSLIHWPTFKYRVGTALTNDNAQLADGLAEVEFQFIISGPNSLFCVPIFVVLGK